MKLNYPKTLKVGTAFAIVMVFWTAYDYVVPLLLENAFGLSNTMRGLIMGLDNLLSLFMLPWFGKLSDRCNSKYGRRTPFIVLGTVATVILMVFVPVSAQKQLNAAKDLRAQIVTTSAKNYTYIDHKGTVYGSAEALYTMLYESRNSDYCDHTYLANNGVDSLEDYLRIAADPQSDDYSKFVEAGINSFASNEINEKLTKANPTSLIVYMVILFFVLVAMATFRSPAVALMPDVTPKPLRSQANAMINLAGGAGGAVAFIIYTVTLLLDPTGYIAIFAAVAASMLLLLVAYLLLVNEKKLVKECQDLCAEYGIDENEDAIPEKSDHIELLPAEKKARMTSFILILASIFMWFMGYNAVSSNLSIYITKTLNLSAGLGGVISGVSMGISAIAFIPVGYLAVKIGRRKSIMLGFALAVVSFALIFFFASNYSAAVIYLFTVFYLIAGFGLITANVNTFPMVVELSSEGNVGKYTGLYYTATMSAQAITPFIAGLVMDALGSKYLFLYSTICVILAIVLMVFVRHGDSKMAPPKSKLELIGAGDD